MKFLSVRYQNFGPFVDENLVLSDRGLALVQGNNQVNPSADSNGSGKSFLLEGIVWCLFGKTIRYDLRGKPTGDQIVARFGPSAGKDCSVQIEIEHGGKYALITRYRKHTVGKNAVVVAIDGTDYTRGTNKETDRFIEEMLGLDFNAFVRSIYFDGQSIVPFPALSDKEIKEVFERVLGLDDLGKVAGVVKDWLRVANGNRMTVSNDIAVSTAQRSTAQAEIASQRASENDWERDTKAKIAGIEAQIATLKAQPIPDLLALDDEDARIAKLEADILAALAPYAALDGMKMKAVGEQARIRGQMVALDAKITRPDPALVQQHADASAKAKATAIELGRAQAATRNAQSKIGHPCSECGKPYTSDDLGHIVSHQGAIAEAKAKELADEQAYVLELEQQGRDDIARQERERDAELAKLAEELQAVEQTLAKCVTLEQKRADLQKGLQELPTLRARVSSQRHAAQQRDASCALLQRQIDDLKAAVNPYTEIVQRWTQRFAECQDEIDAKEKRLAEIMAEIAQYEILEEAYGRTGLKAHILETITPLLNMRANDYAGRLADGTVAIEFSTVTRNRDGSIAERFSVNVTNGQGAEGYLGCSAGERRKIDLSIGLAISDLVAARSGKPIDLWVADEIAESLDPTAVERVVGVLEDKAKERGSILVISHTDMRDLIPNLITVTKTAAGSVLS